MNFQCPHCYKEVSSAGVHWLQMHPEKSFTCGICGETTSWANIQPTNHLLTPTTQKAKGILALRQWVCWLKIPQVFGLQPAKLPWTLSPLAQKALPDGLFARPCPPSPEHGFVESRIVKTEEELEQVRLETLAANEDSEVILMKPIKAFLNQIWTPSLFTIGKGHDGATAGKHTLSIPLAGMNPIPEKVLQASGIAPDAAPYVEAVCEKHPGNFYLTQLRGGPPLDYVSPDFIPEDLTVETIIQTHGEDLLEWAKVVRSLKNKPGVIVYHPHGALTDHYSVHCRANGVPLAISFKPAPGEVLEAASFKQVPPLDPHAMAIGVAVGDRIPLHDYAAWVRLALVALHNSSVMTGGHSFWIGVASAVVLRLGSAALEAEARHAHQCFKGMKNKPDIYKYYTSKGLSFNRARLSRVTQLLHYGFGPVTAHHSYGGPNWALCGASEAPLFNAIRGLLLEESLSSAEEVLSGLNLVINQAHNGGWWLNKFATTQDFNGASKGDLSIPIKASLAFWSAKAVRRSKGEQLLERLKKQAERWPLTEIKPLKWRKASLDIGPGAFVLNLKAATLPKPLEILIPTTPTITKTLLSKTGEITIGGGKITLIGDGVEETLWEEHPLNVEVRVCG